MKRLVNYLQTLVLILCLGATAAGSPAAQGGFKSRWPNPLERGMYQVKVVSTGKILWSVDWETTVTQEKERARVEINEQGRGQPWRYDRPIVWKKRMLFSTEGKDRQTTPLIRIQSVQGTRSTPEGKLLSQMDIQMDAATRKILYRDSSTGKFDRPSVLPWTPEALPDELLFHWIRTLPFGSSPQEWKDPTECNLVVSSTRQFRMSAQIKGTEAITTPAGTFSCYRVELSPKLPLPLKALAPKMALWCRSDPPYYWVRYQGPVGGPGSPQVVIELVEFHEGGGK